jgi:hypothetical protein
MTSAVTSPPVRAQPRPRPLSSRGARLGWWISVALVALAVRLLYSLVIAPAPVGVGGDAGFYQSAANLVADGHFYYRIILGHAYETAQHPPLYPLLLSLGSLLGAKSLLAHRILSCAVGAGAVVVVGLLGERVAGRRGGIAAAAVAAFYPQFVTADALVMSEPLFTLTVAAAVLLAIRLRDVPTLRGSLVLGATVGLAALTRPEGLLLLPLLACPGSYAKNSAGAVRVIAATVALVVVIAPWMVRNAIVFHRFTFATNSNTLIAGANCRDTYYGHDIGWWSLDCLERARTPYQTHIGDASTTAALRYARDHAGRVPLVMAVRVLRTFDLFQPLRQGNREPRRRWVDVVGLVFYFPLLALAVIGLVRMRRSRTVPVWPLLAPVAMVVVTSVLGWGIGRFRIAADVSIIVLAAYALAAVRPVRRRLLASVGAVSILTAGCGGTSATLHPPRSKGLESIFEAPSQLLDAPAGTLDALRRLGVATVRVSVPWASLSPGASSRVRPPFDAATPAAYPEAAWAPYDAIVRDATSRGISVYLDPTGPAPLWATGAGAPGGSPYSQWKPSASAYGAFVRALAKRYSGSYTSAGGGPPLPRVSVWSIWNEPNYGVNLAPQAIDYSTIEVAPSLYRDLLDAAWSALHETGHGRDTILIGELAPRGITVGDSPGNFSGMVPLRFLRALYCVDSSYRRLRGAPATARRCPPDAGSAARFASTHPALFDASGFAAHLYPQGGLPPTFVAPDEPDYADLASVSRLERTLDRLLSVYASTRRFEIYSTEFGYQTSPPEKIARTTDPVTAASYLNWAEYLSWRDPRIRSWDQYLITDPPGGNFASGLEFASGVPKPSFFAYRLPIFLPRTTAAHGHPLEVWGCLRPARYAGLDTGAAQKASIQFKLAGAGHSFRTIRKVTVTDPYGYFDVALRFPSSGSVRLAWTYPRGATIYSRSASVVVR